MEHSDTSGKHGAHREARPKGDSTTEAAADEAARNTMDAPFHPHGDATIQGLEARNFPDVDGSSGLDVNPLSRHSAKFRRKNVDNGQPSGNFNAIAASLPPASIGSTTSPLLSSLMRNQLEKTSATTTAGTAVRTAASSAAPIVVNAATGGGTMINSTATTPTANYSLPPSAWSLTNSRLPPATAPRVPPAAATSTSSHYAPAAMVLAAARTTTTAAAAGIPVLTTARIPPTASSLPDTNGATVPGPEHDDIVSGRGKFMYDHPGSVRFRQIVQNAIAYYEVADSRSLKSIVIDLILDLVGDHVRFLKYHSSTDTWSVMNTPQIRDKVGHALRDCLFEMRREQNQQQNQQQSHQASTSTSGSNVTTAAFPEDNPSHQQEEDDD